MAFIVTQDQPFNAAAYAYFSLLAYDLTATERFEQGRFFAPFQWATGGRATLDTRLPVSGPLPDLTAIAAQTTTTTTTNTTLPETTTALSSTTSTSLPGSSTDAGGSVLLWVGLTLLVASAGAWLIVKVQGKKA